MCDAERDSIAWIQELVAGNQDVVDEFWSHYQPALERLARSRMTPALQRRLGADDVVQSVCRTFFRRAREGEFERIESDSLWALLCAITLTKVRQHARFHHRQRRSFDREQPLESLRNDQVAEAVPTPDDAVAFVDQMEHFCERLGEDERLLVELQLDGLPHKEIAERMDCSERTVRRLLHRVRQQWQQELDELLTN